MHLHEFITTNHKELMDRARTKATQRPWRSVADSELEQGIPLFLTQLAEALRLETTGAPFSATAIGLSATAWGRSLAMGFTVSQVAHDYADVCHATTDLVIEKRATIEPSEFYTLDRCLDAAIAADGVRTTASRGGHRI